MESKMEKEMESKMESEITIQCTSNSSVIVNVKTKNIYFMVDRKNVIYNLPYVQQK